MHSSRRRRLIAAAIVTSWALAPAIAQPPQPQPQPKAPYRSAYDSLDSNKLVESMTQLGMTELLSAYQRHRAEASESPEMKLQRASKTADFDERMALLGDAIAQLDAQAAAMANETDERKVLRRFELGALAVGARVTRVEPYGQKLMYLLGGQADRDVILKCTADIDTVRDLRERMRDVLEDWRGERARRMAVLGSLEEINRQVKYKSAWLLLYRGMAAAEPSVKTALLNDSMTAVSEFIENEEDVPVKRWSELLSGMCVRELAGAVGGKEAQSQYAEAARWLKRIVDAQDRETPAECRAQAMFELARISVDSGKFDQAQKDIAAYAQRGAELLGDKAKLIVDLRVTMLNNYLDETWAQALAASDPAKERELRLKAQQVLVEFADRQSDDRLREAFFGILAEKYRHRTDYENLGSMLLWSIGRSEAGKVLAARKTGRKDEAGAQKAGAVLSTLMTRQDPVATKYRAQVGELLALMAFDSDKLKAARQFAQMAREAKGEDGMRAALNAVIAYDTIITERIKNSAGVEDVRGEFIAALETLLGNQQWVEKPEVRRWFYELGQQCDAASRATADEKQQIALWQRAAAAYDKVAPDAPEYMEAQARELADILPRLLDKAPDAEKPQMAQDLVARLQAYAAKAADAARKSPEDAKLLNSWGATADFRAVQILFEELNKTDQALKILDTLPQKWKGTTILRDAAEFRIVQLVKNGRISEGAESLDQFVKDYPDQGPKLTEFVLAGLRQRVLELRDENDPQSQTELATLRKSYLEFARMLHDRKLAQKLSPQDMYKYKQWLAEAMLENNDADGALKILNDELLPMVKARVAAEYARIDAETAQLVRDLNAVAGDAERVKKKAKEFDDLLAAKGLDPAKSNIAEIVRMGLKYLQQAGDNPADQQFRLANMVDQLRRAYDWLGRYLKSVVDSDAGVAQGLARAYRMKGDYTKAARMFREIVAGFDKTKFPKYYWEAQVEYCQCVLDGFAGDAKVMRDLRGYMENLRIEDPKMWGMETKFAGVLAKVNQAAGLPAASGPTSAPAQAAAPAQGAN